MTVCWQMWRAPSRQKKEVSRQIRRDGVGATLMESRGGLIAVECGDWRLDRLWQRSGGGCRSADLEAGRYAEGPRR